MWNYSCVDFVWSRAILTIVLSLTILAQVTRHGRLWDTWQQNATTEGGSPMSTTAVWCVLVQFHTIEHGSKYVLSQWNIPPSTQYHQGLNFLWLVVYRSEHCWIVLTVLQQIKLDIHSHHRVPHVLYKMLMVTFIFCQAPILFLSSWRLSQSSNWWPSDPQ